MKSIAECLKIKMMNVFSIDWTCPLTPLVGVLYQGHLRLYNGCFPERYSIFTWENKEGSVVNYPRLVSFIRVRLYNFIRKKTYTSKNTTTLQKQKHITVVLKRLLLYQNWRRKKRKFNASLAEISIFNCFIIFIYFKWNIAYSCCRSKFLL